MEEDEGTSSAACRSGGRWTPLFFSDRLDEIAMARSLCRSCQLIDDCLAAALARREPCGVWGGEVFANGAVLAVKRGRGRPRKHPAPEVVRSA